MVWHCMGLPHTNQPPSLRTWRFPGCCSSEWTDKNFGCICHRFVSLSTNERPRFSYLKAEILFPRNDKSDFTAVNHFDDVQLRSIKIIYCLYLSLFTNKAVLYFFDKLSRMALSWINQTLILETKKPRSQPKQARLLKPKQQICCWRCRHGYHGGQRSRQKLGLHLSQGEVLPFLTSRVNAFYTEACLYALQPVFLHISWGHLLCGKRLVFVEHSLCIHHIA